MQERIIQAAAQAINERGTKFTIDSVAQRLGISKKTLYQYVVSKEDLIRLVVDTALEDVDRQQGEILQSDRSDLEKLAALLSLQPHRFGVINDWIFDDLRHSCPEIWENVEKFRFHQTEIVVELLEAGKASGEIRPVNSKVAAQALRGALREMSDYAFLTSANLTLQDAIAGCVDTLVYGLRASGGETC